MMARTNARDADGGFSLIELLVVVIIIGILAAIAVPIFLVQRKKAYDSAAKSDLRNLASFEEVTLAEDGAYSDIATMVGAGHGIRVSKQVTLTVVKYDGVLGYCLSAHHAGSANTWYYDSRGGGLQAKGATGCSVSTAGTPGDSLSG